jgi:structural maintenance of chromosome 2
VQLAALKTMEKKDAKLKETETLLAEEITPNMNKLKQERSAFIEFQKNNV